MIATAIGPQNSLPIDKGIIDLRPLVTHVVPLQEYPELMQQIVAGDPTYIKGVVSL